MEQVIDNQVVNLKHIVYAKKKEVEAMAQKAINKAKKFGIAAPTFEYSDKYLHHFTATDWYGGDNYDSFRMAEDCFDVTITIPEEMKLEGDWNLFAFIHHDKEHIEQFDLNQELPVEYGIHTKKCDHCQRKQSRAKSYIIQNKKTGKFMQVGTTCLKDFIGIDPSRWIAGYEAVSHFSNFIFTESGFFAPKNYGWNNVAYNRLEGLSLAAAIIEKEGYVKAEWKDEGREGRYGWESKLVRTNLGEATTDKVEEYMDKKREAIEAGEVFKEQIDFDKAAPIVEEFITYFESLELEPKVDEDGTKYFTSFDEWQLSIKSELSTKFLRLRELKQVIGGLGYFVKKKAKDAAKQAKIDAGEVSKHYGEIKKRYKGIEVTCIGNRYRESDFGGYHITKLEAGFDVLIYFGNVFEDLNEGDKATIDFTVKAHNEFKGELNTQINRPKLIK